MFLLVKAPIDQHLNHNYQLFQATFYCQNKPNHQELDHRNSPDTSLRVGAEKRHDAQKSIRCFPYLRYNFSRTMLDRMTPNRR